MSHKNGSCKFDNENGNGSNLIRLHPREDSFQVSQGRSVLSTDITGFICPKTKDGFFVHQTRMLSEYRWLLDNVEPLAVALSNVEQHSWLGYYIQVSGSMKNRDRGSGELAKASEKSVELRLSRSVSYGLHEDVDLTNFTQKSIKLKLQLKVAADFADQEETATNRKQFGKVNCKWGKNGKGNWELAFDYVSHHHYLHQEDEGNVCLHRSLAIEIAHCNSAPTYSRGTISFSVSLQPLQSWHTCVRFSPIVDDEPSFPLYKCYAFRSSDHSFDTTRGEFISNTAQFRNPASSLLSETVLSALERAKYDLAALRLHDLDQGEGAWVPAAGIPIYIALFGRDTLTVAWQVAAVTSEIMLGTLPVIANLQGQVVDNWRDEQPGRMLHEAHTAPLAKLGFNPRARYYGSATTSGFYPVVLAELWHWTGDKELIRPFIEPALRGLRWKDEWADQDGDGFYEYQTHSSQGVKNQGWKDSGDAIVYPDGSEVAAPIATCEEQAFVYVSKLHMAEMLWWLDRKDEARHLYHQAEDLQKRFNEAFWVEEEGFFALGLDAQKRQIRSIASNPGHCVACGIVDQHLVQRTVDRLLARDMFTGWGVRTLSADHPAFNPFSYHRGSVWPVEHASFAMGFMRYGLHSELQRIAKGMFEAAAIFDFQRLPELFSGHQRDDLHPFPAMYPKTNWPQAWSSGAVFTLVQCMLGIYPYAPLHALFLDPHLPDWLPAIEIRNLHVGKAVVGLRFYRTPDGNSSYEVLDKQGPLHVVRQPSPWSLTTGPVERIVDALSSVLPS